MGGNDLQAQWDAASEAPFLYIGAIAAVALVIWAILHFLYRHRIDGLKDELDRERREIARLREGPGHRDPLPRGAPTQKKVDAVVTAEDESPTSAADTGQIDRVYLGKSITSKFLRDHFLDQTRHQALRAMQPYLGKWMRVKGTVRDVTSRELSWSVGIDDGSESSSSIGANIWIKFDKSAIPKLETLRKGDVVRVRGKLEEVSSLWVDLVDGELLGS